MKRGRRLTPPQILQRKSIRVMFQQLRRIQDSLEAWCQLEGHQYDYTLGYCRKCGPMNRRDALKLLAGLPLLGFLKPEVVEAPEVFFDIIEDNPPPHQFVTKLTNGPDDMIYAGGSFVGGVAWNGTTYGAIGTKLEISADGNNWIDVAPAGDLHISGNFIEEDIAQLRKRISKSG